MQVTVLNCDIMIHGHCELSRPLFTFIGWYFSYLKAVQSILKKNLKVIGYKSRRKTGIAARCLSDGNSHNLLGAGKSVDLTEILRYV